MISIIPHWSEEGPERYTTKIEEGVYRGLGTLAVTMSVGAFNLAWISIGCPTVDEYWSNEFSQEHPSLSWIALSHDRPIEGWLPMHQASMMSLQKFYKSLTPGKRLTLNQLARYDLCALLAAQVAKES